VQRQKRCWRGKGYILCYRPDGIGANIDDRLVRKAQKSCIIRCIRIEVAIVIWTGSQVRYLVRIVLCVRKMLTGLDRERILVSNDPVARNARHVRPRKFDDALETL